MDDPSTTLGLHPNTMGSPPVTIGRPMGYCQNVMGDPQAIITSLVTYEQPLSYYS